MVIFTRRHTEAQCKPDCDYKKSAIASSPHLCFCSLTMKYCALLALLLALGCAHVRAAPLEGDSRVAGSCEDPRALGAAEQALIKINEDRHEGYVFALDRLSNVHYTRHVSCTTGQYSVLMRVGQ